ncbi:hypothetical protein P171DRAFT_44447 [Karstenula rhodostoma CBS 690.94]|uniref:USP domain-containing protein n=1 Tax=Karstenula rhodostoma CBS 690.94 TaxID=1392251 RepID=A0A9P4U9U8_9PLEO|nr:hypothetical protein P171DRAFT_44447 [Karstenula rhodostoma CBS 690.94]
MDDANTVYNEFLFDSTHGLAAGAGAWKKQFDTIFNLERVPFDACYECGIERKRNEPPTTGLDVPTRPQRRPSQLFNSVSEAINGAFEIETLAEVRCETPSCLRLRRTKYTVLKIRLLIAEHTLVAEQNARKIFETLAIDETLDLTQLQAAGSDSVPLTYRLSTVVSHSGESLDNGHYIASVRSPGTKPFYNISDEHWVQPISRQRFTANPQQNRKTEDEQFEVNILTYIMDEQLQVIPEKTRRMLRELA